MRMLQKVTSLIWKYRAQVRSALTPAEARERTVNEFHQLYYDLGPQGKTWGDTRWFGVRAGKCPLDLWLYQEILFEVRPDLIIETGTAEGGSALFLASMCDLLNHGRVMTVDIDDRPRPAHARVTYLSGSSTAPAMIAQFDTARRGVATCMVVLDSDHSNAHVLEELNLYSRFVSLDSYLIVEDTNVNGNPVFPEHGPGPMEALNTFMATNRDFVIDDTKHKFLLTFNPRGFLKRTGR